MDTGVIYHKGLAASDRWTKLSFCEQMANCGMEVRRALDWREKGKEEHAERAFERSLELLDFTISTQWAAGARTPRLRELLRVRELWCGCFLEEGRYLQYGTTPEWFRRYFGFFAPRAARERQTKASHGGNRPS